MSQRNVERRPVRKLSPEQRRRIQEKRRRARLRRRIRTLLPALALVLVVALGLGLALRGRGSKVVDAQPAATAEAQEPSPIEDSSASTLDAQSSAERAEAFRVDQAFGESGESVFVFDDAYVSAMRGEETGALIIPDYSKVDPSKLSRWPKVDEGCMPVLYEAEAASDKFIAITVDDCFQGENLRRIVQCALDNGGKLTIFPIGSNLMKENVGAAVKWAWENGMEIENHTYNHVGLYHYNDERMTKEIWMQSQALDQVLGVNYQQHFFRPRGGDERNDQRVHAYVNQLGMSGIAIWSQAFLSKEGNALTLKPGNIYLFHTTDNDTKRLLEFIPEAARQGYQLVTMNEMFGLPENETSPLQPVSDPPALQPFQIKPALLIKTTYVRAAAVVQKRLIELGWLDGEADGVFGKSSYVATGQFQLAANMAADGKAGAETQAVLFSDDAPAATAENLAKVEAKMKK